MSDIDERTAAREALLLAEQESQRQLYRHEDYVFDQSQEMFWNLKLGAICGPLGVDRSIPQERWRVIITPPGPRGGAPRERMVKPSDDIGQIENDQFVEGSTWWPGKPQIVKDWYIDASGYFPMNGARMYNKYRAPPRLDGDKEKAGPWIRHVKKLWPDPREHNYFFDYCAHMIQRPEEKCNAAIVLSGTQGIGKDAALHPVKMAIGIWNTKGIDPDDLFSQFKPWLETVMLVVDEVRPTKEEFHASSMYNILKPMIVAPPDVLPLNDKFTKLRYIINILRVFITTNDYLSMYIPPEDRRMFIMHSTLPQKWHEAEGFPHYFADLFQWFEAGGAGHVAAWLRERDLSEFDPKSQVEKTTGWAAVANTWGEPDDAVAHALEALGSPDVLFGAELVNEQFDYAEEVRGMLKSPRKIGHRMQRSGYMLVNCPTAPRWSFRGEGRVFRSRMAFVKQELMHEPARCIKLIEQRGERLANEKGTSDDA